MEKEEFMWVSLFKVSETHAIFRKYKCCEMTAWRDATDCTRECSAKLNKKNSQAVSGSRKRILRISLIWRAFEYGGEL